MPSSATLEIVSRAINLVTAISDVPVMSVLKPIGGILRTICDHLSALEDNKEAVIKLAKRVNQVVEVLTNRTQNLNGIVPGNYSNDIQRLEDVLIEIATALEKSRQRSWLKRKLAPNADTAKLNTLSSGLDYAITMFGLSANIETRLTYQTVRAFVPNGDSEVLGPTINHNALRSDKELYKTVDYSVQVGTYDNQAVVFKKYYRAHEENIKIDISRVRYPWKGQRIGPQIAFGDMERQSSRPPSTSRPSSYPSEGMHAPFETLTIKESAELDVVQYFGDMQVAVA
ncbi:hypothetical protein FRC04_001179 [Tulasnella sp. 424]|nr:hypothetical protein FRC04_001179 [Tulasnella sp. 424]